VKAGDVVAEALMRSLLCPEGRLSQDTVLLRRYGRKKFTAAIRWKSECRLPLTCGNFASKILAQLFFRTA
jgi:hypothetical protein